MSEDDEGSLLRGPRRALDRLQTQGKTSFQGSVRQ
jgi:hypothetical protein